MTAIGKRKARYFIPLCTLSRLGVLYTHTHVYEIFYTIFYIRLSIFTFMCYNTITTLFFHRRVDLTFYTETITLSSPRLHVAPVQVCSCHPLVLKYIYRIAIIIITTTLYLSCFLSLFSPPRWRRRSRRRKIIHIKNTLFHINCICVRVV